MVYSKFLKHSNSVIGRNLHNFKYSHRNVKPYLLNTATKVSTCGSPIYISNCQYSTILSSKFSDPLSKPASKCISPLSLTALFSSGGSNETYQIVITNPAEGTSSTLNTSLDSVSAIKSAEELPLPASDVTDVATTLSDQLTTVVDVLEPSFTSLGLANYTPVGAVQMFLEYLHVSMHWPWWMTIIACTAVARVLLFPLLLKTQKNAIRMSNYMPQLQYLQAKFGEARRTGNSMEASRYANEMMMFMKNNNISPMKNAMLPLLQAPVFLSFFFALRDMAKTPVESMKDGGIWWASDLTIPDPYYVLPAVACGTLYIVLKIGAESGVRMENMKLAKYFVQALPVIAFPFCMNFSSAILYYWVTNNFCTLAIVSVLKIKPVREYFNLPTPQKIDPKFVVPKKGFVAGMKEAFEDQKILASVEERRRMDDIKFQKAGTGPIPRTYSYDPTKPRPSNVASTTSKNILAKERKV